VFVFSLHAPFACIGFFALFMHGSGDEFGDLEGSELTEVVFIGSVVIAVLFFLFTKIRELEVDQRQSKFGTNFIFLSVKYSDSDYIPPGSFFNLYASADSYMSIFHCHSFPVFSTRNSRIVFLIKCRNKSNWKRSSSFTSRLGRDKPPCVRLQGPFQGLVSSFILSLNSVSNNRTPKCIFLCGWDSGFASVFSLLEYFQEKAKVHNIHSIACMFSKISDENVRDGVHNHVDHLVHEWDWEIPLSIIESDKIDDFNIMTSHHDTLLLEGMDKSKWQKMFPFREIWFAEKTRDEGINVAPRSWTMERKVLYFCGDNFKHELFPEPKWQTFVESS